MKRAIFLVITTTGLVSGVCRAQGFTRLISDPVVSDLRYSEGSSWGDINNDGLLDLFVPHLHTDQGNVLFLNVDGERFIELQSGPVVTDPARSTGGIFGDFDNDGDLDLFVSNYYGLDNLFYLNDGSGSFAKVTDGAVVTDGGFSFGSSAADYDNDGFLDLYVTNGAQRLEGENNFLYHNNGDGTFTRKTDAAPAVDGKSSSSSSWCDYDNDGDPDLFVANGFTENEADVNNAFYQNNGDETFTSIDPVTIGIDHSYSSNGSWADYDNDGDFDLFITNFLGNNNSLYQNNGDGTFTRMLDGIINNDGGDSVSSTWGDYDNDGDLDLFVTNDFNENNNLYANNGDRTFTKVTSGDPSNDGGRSNGATWADYNNDGYLDLFVPNGQRPVGQQNIMYRNDGSARNNWINIQCTGTLSNASAIGTKIYAKTVDQGNTKWQMRQVSGGSGFNAQNSLNIEFGLGRVSVVDSLIIEWPSGTIDRYSVVPAGVFYEATEAVGLDLTTLSTSDRSPVPTEIGILLNYPNPFSEKATIRYEIQTGSHVRLHVINTLGQRVIALVTEFQPAGTYEVALNASSLKSGVYFLELVTGNRAKFEKMIHLW